MLLLEYIPKIKYLYSILWHCISGDIITLNNSDIRSNTKVPAPLVNNHFAIKSFIDVRETMKLE